KYKSLIISTNNIHKLEEIRKILKDLPIKVLSKKDIGLENFQIIEDGNTLTENSIKKSQGLSEKTDHMVMADDSGLFVDVLDGEPGIYSSRYAGEEGNDKKNNEKLLQRMKDIPLEDRRAKFITVISLVTEEKEVITVSGECKGYIIYETKGNHGFGYDPLFIPDGYKQTFGELDEKVKNSISHRSKALRNFREIIIELVKGEEA